MTTMPARTTSGLTFKYLKRDGDPEMSWFDRARRQVTECASETKQSLTMFGASGAKLSGWVVAYHAGMFLKPFATRQVMTLSLPVNRRMLEVSFRKNQSDLYILRENFIEQIYRYDGLPRNDVRTVVDFGANAGLSALYFQAQYPNARLLCVEPVSHNIEMLERNRDQNDFEWTLLKAAVAGKSGEITLYPNEWWSSSTTTEHVAEAREGNDGRLEKIYALPPETVPALTVQEILDSNDLDVVDLLKMDIEGAEEAVFQADTSWLSRVRVLIIEIHDKYVDRLAIEQHLKSAGFVKQENRHGPTDAYVNSRLVAAV
jgi:FkbM family methyltransferase